MTVDALPVVALRDGRDLHSVFALGGRPILRCPGAPAAEPPHDHAHAGHNGVTMAPLTSARTQGGAQESLMLGSPKGSLRSLAQWLILDAVIGAMLNSKDIQRYPKIRSK